MEHYDRTTFYHPALVWLNSLMKILFLVSIFLIISCQNMAVERNPNSFNFEFDPSKSCDGVNISLADLNSHKTYKYQRGEVSTWLEPASSTKAVALVAHGLNLKPSKMNALAKVLTSHDVEVLRVSLAGHRGSKREGLFTTHRIWRNEFQAHYCLAMKKAASLKVPLYFLGFSLGALTGVDFLNTQNSHTVEKMILISPATDVHWYSKIPGNLGWIGGRISLPSKNIKSYRSQPSTSLASYRAMKESQDSLKDINLTSLNIPTLIFVDPDDELVSLKKINKRIKNQRIDLWQTKSISNKGSTLKKTYHHLVVDKPSMGPHQWNLVRKNIIKHFDLKK